MWACDALAERPKVSPPAEPPADHHFGHFKESCLLLKGTLTLPAFPFFFFPFFFNPAPIFMIVANVVEFILCVTLILMEFKPAAVQR